MNEVVIGVDGGTTAVKAVAFALDGSIVATHHEVVPVDYGTAGEAEQDMNKIWDAVAACLRSVTEQLGDTKVIAVGLTGQGDDPWGGKRAGFEAAGKIHLKDFNITTDLGPASQDVELIISVEGVQQKS